MLEIITKTTKVSSWAEIKEALDKPYPVVLEWLHSGDMIPVTLKNGAELILDVARDETGKLFFVFHDCLTDAHCMNKRGTTEGGWAASDMRKYVHEVILPLLPDELQAVIAPTKIVQIINGERIECEDKLFCLSYTQVFGKDWPWMNEREPEDSQLDIFKTERTRVKERDGETAWWWLRSASFNYYFMCVYYYGSYDYSSAYTSGGVALGFSL